MFWFWKKNKGKTRVVIHDTCHKKLPVHIQQDFDQHYAYIDEDPVTHRVQQEGNNFLLSYAVGEATDSVLLGTLAGGNVGGALMGEMVAESIKQDYSPDIDSINPASLNNPGPAVDSVSMPDTTYDPGPSQNSFNVPDSSPNFDMQ